MNSSKAVCALAAVWFLAGMAPVLAADDHHAHQHVMESAETGSNPLIEEMVKLDAVFRDVVSGVALGDGARVQKAVASMHGTMEKTHEGVHHGTVRLTKNADRIEEFVLRDRQFHAGLESLATAAEKNDRDNMLRLTKKLLDECVQCHREFRNR
jgi:cytochrome c556